MDPKVEALAIRLRAVLDEHASSRQEAAAARAERLREAREARASLLEDLQSFGGALGHLDTEASEGRVVYRWGGRALLFVAEGPGDRVRVSFGAVGSEDDAESPVQLRRDGQVWMVVVAQDGVEHVEPLIERGLVHLLVEGLDLPLPKAAPRAQPALDDLVPAD